MSSPRSIRLTLALLGLVAAPLALPAVAQAQPPVLTVTAAPAYADQRVSIALSLVDAEGPVVAEELVVERLRRGSWRPVATVVTDAGGRAAVPVTVSRAPADNRVRVTWPGDGVEGPVTVEKALPLLRRTSRLRLTGPRTFVDETRARLTVVWRARGGPVPGKVKLQQKKRKRWKTMQAKGTGADGTATFTVSPRKDTVWRAVAPALPWVARARSGKHRLRNLPPGVPVRLPKRAPRPRLKLPPQQHAKGAGANAVVTAIPGRVWRQMVGRSWHRGCPVGRSGLRLLRINYWDYDGYRRRGELVAAAGAIDNMAAALRAMYARNLPIRSMYRVDRFGWSRRLGGADDYKSMAAGNTSAFNCRQVVGRPGVRSPHATGRSLDVNPWENPYRASHGWTPNSWWASRSHQRVGWRSRSHPVVRLMARHGMRWTYGRSDLHHFDASGAGRVVVPEACRGEVCH